MEPRQRIELSFDCMPPLGEYRREERWKSPSIEVDQILGGANRLVSTDLVVPPDTLVLFFNIEGSALMRPETDRKWIVAPTRSVVFVRGPARIITNIARGRHSAYMVVWSGWTTPHLNTWLNQRQQAASVQRQRIIASKPIDPQFATSFDRFEQVLAGPDDLLEPLILSVLYEIVPTLIAGRDELQLAPLPPDLPASIRKLVIEVSKHPELQWPLKDAASTAGYSPFHFSRVFKSLVGYGFHEFVDRCRTEFAVEKLCETDMPVDMVASAAGFGTTQGLRESVKEYLGLVPSELRLASDV